MHPDDGRVVSNFIIQALENKPITIYGDGLQTRSFCYVDDLIDGLMLLMDTSNDFTGPVNLGNPNEITIQELANLIIKKTKSNSPIIKKPLPPDDPRQRQPDINLAKTILEWEPTTTLNSGLTQTINYFSNTLNE